MGNQIIKQPDGRLAVFSTTTGAFAVYDATPEEIADWFARQAAQDAHREATRTANLVSNGSDAYGGLGMSWAEASLMNERHSGEPWTAHPNTQPPK
jgi:hypothetical protein